MEDTERTDNNVVHVLQVDDDPLVLSVSKQYLKTMGNFEIDIATTVDEALTNLKQQRYDVVVSDHEMPEKNGLDFLKLLDGQLNRPPFILFTGMGSEETAVKAINLGANGYINKPGDAQAVYSELASRIKSLATKYRTEMKIKQNDALLRSVYEHKL
jgi:DNA-binding NtrC family response regulator